MAMRNDKSFTLRDFTSVFVEEHHAQSGSPKIHVDANIDLPSLSSGVVVLSGTLLPDDVTSESTIDEFLDQEWERHEAALRYLADR
jgi:hypothetical protein